MFAAIPLTGEQTCPGNPSAPVTISLSAPLGDRVLLDGLVVGPLAGLVDGWPLTAARPRVPSRDPGDGAPGEPGAK